MALRTEPRNWCPPPSVIAAGDSARVAYRNPPLRSEIPAQYKSARRTQLPLRPGTILVRNVIADQFGVRQTYMPGRSRPMIDSQRLDTHQAGRAIDFMTDKATGDAIANYCVSNADAMGVQFVVWCGNRWSAGARPGQRWEAYSGASGHYDHPHVELTPDGAEGRTRWFVGRTLPSAQEITRVTATAPEAGYMDHGESATIIVPVIASVVGVATVIAGSLYLRSRM